MNDAARAILHITDELGVDLDQPALLINAGRENLSGLFPNAAEWQPAQEDKPPEGAYSIVILMAPQQKDETRYLMAAALQQLSRGGTFITAAANDAGGKTLAKMLSGFGLSVSDYSKHKCRVVVTHQPKLARPDQIQTAIESGGPQQRGDGFWSQPGLFAWDRIDTGTATLLHNLPFGLQGKGADFGCGIGVIGQRILQRYKDVEKLTCIDIDARAISCAHKNLAEWKGRTDIRQEDITADFKLPLQDFIIMNPPFHQGKQEAIALGQAFIKKAAKHLKPDGILMFVANTHLPYEEIVQQNFSFTRVLSEKTGFKIIEAVK